MPNIHPSKIETSLADDEGLKSKPCDTSGGTGGEQSVAKNDYLVGYARPPQQFRFKPGQSGNPKGRPKGAPNLKTIVERALRKTVKVREGNEVRNKSTLQAILDTHATKARKGDARCAGLIFNLVPKAGLFDDRIGAADARLGGSLALQPFDRRPSRELFENIDLTQLSEDDRVELSRLAEIVDMGGGMTALTVSDFARARDLVNQARGIDITPNNQPFAK
jgi:hypothetical protein